MSSEVNIQAATGRSRVKYKKGNTSDIIKEVLECYQQTYSQVKDFAPSLQGSSITETCSNVWNFIKQNIHYKIDPPGVQWIKTPARLWSDKEGDCKSFSVMAASLLNNLGITPTFRFVSYSILDDTATHVYVVALLKNEEIIIDAVYDSFNAQQQYAYKKDYTMAAQISRLSGLENYQGKQVLSTPEVRKLAFQLDSLLIDRLNEIKAGVYTAQRKALYDKYISQTKQDLDKAVGFNITDGISGGMFGGWLGIDDKYKKQASEFIPKAAPTFMYLFWHWHSKREAQSWGNISIDMFKNDTFLAGDFGIQIPDWLKNKRQEAFNCLNHIGGQCGDGSFESFVFPLLLNSLKQQLGMPPKLYWERFFLGTQNGVGGFFGDAFTNYSSSSSNTQGDVKGSILGAAGKVFGIPGLSIVQGFLSNIIGGLIPDLELTPEPSVFTPDMNDWKNTNYPLDKTLIKSETTGNNNNTNTGGGNNTNTGGAGSNTVDDLNNNQKSNSGLLLGLGTAAALLLK